MKKILFLLIFLLATEVFSKELHIYKDVDENLETVYSKAVEKVVTSGKEKNIIVINENKPRYIEQIRFSNKYESVDTNKYPLVEISIKKTQTIYDLPTYEFEFSYKKNLEERIAYSYEFSEDYNEEQFVEIASKSLEGFFSFLDNEDEKTEERKSLNFDEIDSFDIYNYQEGENEKETYYKDQVKVLSDGSMVCRVGKEIYLFSSSWNRKKCLTDDIPEVDKKKPWAWIPCVLDNGQIMIFKHNCNNIYLFDQNGKFIEKKFVLLPEIQYPMIYGLKDGKIANRTGSLKEGFNYNISSLEENKFDMKIFPGDGTDIIAGNNGDIWIPVGNVNFVYDNKSNLKKVIYNKEDKENTYLSLVDSENNYYTYERFLGNIKKYDYDGNLICKYKLPTKYNDSIINDVQNGIIYLWSQGKVIRYVEADKKIPNFLEQVKERNKKIVDEKDKKNNSNVYKELASIYYKNGGTAAAIQYLEKYLEYCPADNESSENLLKYKFELAKIQAKEYLENTISLYEEYGEETAKETYNKAAKVIEKYKKYFPNDLEINQMYNELKSIYDVSLVKEIKIPNIEIQKVDIGYLFPALMNVYSSEPSGFVTIKNNSKEQIKNIRVNSYIRKYMDFASESESVQTLDPGEIVSIPIKTILNNSVLEINENLNLQMKLSIKWNESSKENSMDIIRPVTICKKSAIVWNDTAMLSCFILPNDKTVTDFAIRSIRNKEKIISKELANGVYICNSVGSLPISYIADPKTPVVENLQNKYAVDTVRFPFETLEFKGGDCDDLTTLLCSLMESCGIQTALITTPGHIFVAFNTKMTYSKTWENLSEEYGVLDVDGTVWIPIEVTAVGKGFLEAWKIGTSILMTEDFEFVSVEDSFTRYKSVTAIIPEKELYVETQMEKNLNREAEEKINLLFNNSLQKSSVECVEVDELNILAEEYFLIGQIEKSIEVLLKAYSLEQNNQNVLENLAELYRIKGDEKASKKYFDKAQKIQNNFEEKVKTQTRESDNSSISLKNKSEVKKSTGGVRIKNKQGVIKRTKPVVSNIKSETVTQRSVQTTSSRADEINIFKWKK